MGFLQRLKNWLGAFRPEASPQQVELAPLEREKRVAVAFERLVQHFDERELRFEADPEQQLVYASFWCEFCLARITAAVEEGDRLFQVFADVPVRIPEGARSAVAETLTRANMGLRLGKFEFDVDRGVLRYQASTMLPEDGALDDEVISRLIGTSLAMVDRYLPAVLSVVFANEAPADAVRRVDADQARPNADADDSST